MGKKQLQKKSDFHNKSAHSFAFFAVVIPLSICPEKLKSSLITLGIEFTNREWGHHVSSSMG